MAKGSKVKIEVGGPVWLTTCSLPDRWILTSSNRTAENWKRLGDTVIPGIFTPTPLKPKKRKAKPPSSFLERVVKKGRK